MIQSPLNPVIGKHYRVPCVFAPDLGGWVPILGPAHHDREHLGIHVEHWHIDYRILGERAYQSHHVNGRTTPYGHFVSVRESENSALPLAECPVWLPALEHAFEGKALPACGTCPHRGIPVDTMQPDAEGNVTCPGHGLTWNLKSRKLVRRTQGGELARATCPSCGEMKRLSMGRQEAETAKGGGRGTTRTKGTFFYALRDVVAFLKDRPRLLVYLHPDARRLLKLEMPASPPGGKPLPLSRTLEYRRARARRIPKLPCAVCGAGLVASKTRHGVCTRTQACRDERQRRMWQAIKRRQIETGVRKPARRCERCGGELLPTAKYGVCKRNSDCKRENERRYAIARGPRRKPAANPLTISNPTPRKEVA